MKCCFEFPVAIDQLIDGVIPTVYPASIDGIFTNEKQFFVLGVEGAANNCIIVGLDIFVIFILEKSLVDNFLRQFSLVNHHKSSSVVEPKAISAKSLLIIKGH